MTLLVVGALHWDVVVSADRLPRIDETLRGQGVDYRLGGKAGNQAIAAAKAGAPVAFAGRVGDDEPGRVMTQTLADAGIDLSQLQRGTGPSGMSVAITTDGGDYGAVIVSAENHAFDFGEFAVPDGRRIVLAQNELAAGSLETLSEMVRRAGAEFWVNLAPSGDFDPQFADVLIVNRLEAGDLLGAEVSDPIAAVVAMGALAPRTDCIVTLGADGAVVKPCGRKPFHCPGLPVTAVSTHGAGDVFCGTLAAARLNDAEWQKAIEAAQAAAAAHVVQSR